MNPGVRVEPNFVSEEESEAIVKELKEIISKYGIDHLAGQGLRVFALEEEMSVPPPHKTSTATREEGGDPETGASVTNGDAKGGSPTDLEATSSKVNMTSRHGMHTHECVRTSCLT